jgi:hypothetical protein
MKKRVVTHDSAGRSRKVAVPAYRTSQGRVLAVQPSPPDQRQGQQVQRKETDDRV